MMLRRPFKRVILVGAGASGKDYAKSRLVESGLRLSVSYTTRPAREGEVDGVDYHFVSVEEFKSKISEDFFFEHMEFVPGWHYGKSKDAFDDEDVVTIMTPQPINLLSDVQRSESIVVYFNVDRATRENRLRGRNDADSHTRRLETDDALFDGFTNYDVEITDPAYTLEHLLEAITDYQASMLAIKQDTNR